MSVRLEPDEAWAVVQASHTGILTTLRADGRPVALPVWFVVLDQAICMSAPTRTKKVARLRHDPRASFLVESGEHWAELEAVHLGGNVEIVEDPALVARIAEAIEVKYTAFQTPPEAMPAETRERYDGRTFLRFVPEGRILSWDNRRIDLREDQ